MKNRKSFLTVALMTLLSSGAYGATTERISSDSSGGLSPSISDDGRYVAFQTGANPMDVFVRDRATGVVEQISVDGSGAPGNGNSSYPAISADGRYVVFYSDATNLVPNDTNNSTDVFVRDRVAGTTERVNVDSTGTQANAGYSYMSGIAISADGRYVVFPSTATNLVPNDTNGSGDVFIRDRLTGTTELVSVNSAGIQADGGGMNPALSADGRYVVFASLSTNLGASVPANFHIYRRDRVLATTEPVDNPNDYAYTAGVSASGRYIVFGTQNVGQQIHVYVRDMDTGALEMADVNDAGVPGNDMSFNGYARYISANGRYVVFSSWADNLVPGDTNGTQDTFIRDRVAHTTQAVTVDAYGVPGTPSSGYQGGSRVSGVSANGRYVAFESSFTNLVANDTNDAFDVFVRDMVGGACQP